MTGARPVLPYPCLCLVTDPAVCPREELAGRVSAAVSGGVDVVQLRDKELPGAVLLELTQEIQTVIADRALLLVNERVDVAVAAQAEGVQLGEAGLPTDVSRRLLGDAALIGRSVHSVEGANLAAQSGADFLLVGTMFATRSHPGEEPAGPELLHRIKDAGVATPMLGIGGITETNVRQVMAAAAHGGAVITAVLAAEDPRAAAERLKSAMIDGSMGSTGMNEAGRLTAMPSLTGGVSPP